MIPTPITSTMMKRMELGVEGAPLNTASMASSDNESISHESHGNSSGEYDSSSQPSGVILRTGRVRMPDKLIEYLNKRVVSDVLYWQPDGISFSFHGKTVQEGLLDPYFHGTKLSSFTRSLNRWGFQRVFYHSDPKHVYTYRHPLFQKNRPDLVKDMKMPNYPSKTAAAAAKEPQTFRPQPIGSAFTALPRGGEDSHRRTESEASSLSANSDQSSSNHCQSVPQLLQGLLHQQQQQQRSVVPLNLEQGTTSVLNDWVAQLKSQLNGPQANGVSQAAKTLLQNLAVANPRAAAASSSSATSSPAHSPQLRAANVLSSLTHELEALAAINANGNGTNPRQQQPQAPPPVHMTNTSHVSPQLQQALVERLPHMTPSQQQQAMKMLCPQLLQSMQNQLQQQQQSPRAAPVARPSPPPERLALLTLLQAGLPAFFPPTSANVRRN